MFGLWYGREVLAMARQMMLLFAALALAAPAAGEPRSAGKWLVDLGRDYAQSPQAGLSNADAEITLLFMTAATRVEPGLAEGYRWQHELLTALGRSTEAIRALSRYVELKPQDTPSHLLWISSTIDLLQTAKARADFCRQYLQRGDLPDVIVGVLHYRLADFHLNRGELAEARREAEAALEADPLNVAARMVLDELIDLEGSDTTWLADPDAEDERRARRLIAELRLNPAATSAAWELANLLRDWGLTDQANRWYEHAARIFRLIPPGTPPAEFTTDREKKVEPEGEPPAEVVALLEAFPEALLDYPFDPGAYLNAMLDIESKELAPGEPWWCRIRLENKGSFPITLGAGMMVTPDLLCAVQTRGDKARTSGPTLHVSLDRRVRILPGDALEVRQTLDVGPIRSSMLGTPQMAHEVELSAVLSPVALVDETGQETWAPDVGGMLLAPLTFRRAAIEPTGQALGQLVVRSRTGGVLERIMSLQQLAMLVAERQHLDAGRLRYRARPIDSAAVQAALLERVDDEDEQVRARLAECLRWFVLDDAARQVLVRLRGDRHWLVRGLALRALADHYQSRVVKGLEGHVTTDPDEWVQRFAAALIERIQPATKPAPAGE